MSLRFISGTSVPSDVKPGTDGVDDGLHAAERKLATKLASICSSSLPVELKRAIAAFIAAEEGEKSPLTRLKHATWLASVGEVLPDDLLHPTPATRDRWKAAFPPERYERASREACWYACRAFWGRRKFRGHTHEDDALPPWLTVRFGKAKPSKISPETVLSHDEVARIADVMPSLRDRAWIWTSFYSDRRPGEVYALRVGDVKRREEGYVVVFFRGEKGSPDVSIPLYDEAVPSLLQWLDVHPRRNEPEAPLWVSLRGGEFGHQANYKTMTKALEVGAARAKLGKPVWPYLLRHSGITHDRVNPGISDGVLSVKVGWTPGTRRLATYSHLSGQSL
jgi:integrase